VLLILGVPDVVIDPIMRWEPGGAARMRARYMHVTGPCSARSHSKSATRCGNSRKPTETDNVEGPHRERWGPSTSCPVRHWRRIRDSNS
jgi:hypothetical protein